jgi:tetratricopeptide (TPR) repeat protein
MKKIILSALALLLVGATCVDVNAQEKTKEQLKAEAAAKKAMKKEFDGYLKTAKKNSQFGEGVTPNIEVAREAIKNASKLSISEGNADFYLTAGQVETTAFKLAALSQKYEEYAAAAQAGFDYYSKAYDAAVGSNAKAVAAAQEGAFEIYNQTSGLSMIGNVYYQFKDYPKSLAAFRNAKVAFNTPVIDSQKAKPEVAAVLAVCKADSTINNLSLNSFSVAQYQMNDTTEAIKELLYLKDHTTDQTQLNQVLQSLALDYYGLDDSLAFENTLKEGIQKLPSEPWYITNLINVYIGRNDLNSASVFLDKAIESDPSNAALVNTKGLLLEQQEKVDEALKYYEKALELDPTSASVNSSLGRYYFNRAQAVEDEYYNKKKFDEGDRQATPMYDKALPYYEAAYAFDTERKDKNVGIALRQLYGRKIAKLGSNSVQGKELAGKRAEVMAAYGLE